MRGISLGAVGSVAYKEFLHIYRDRRVLILLLILPPVFTLIFGHAFEVGDPTNVPALLTDADKTPRSQRFVDLALTNKTFAWRMQSPRGWRRERFAAQRCERRPHYSSRLERESR